MRSKGFTGSTKTTTAVTQPRGSKLAVKGQSPRKPQPADSPEDEREVAVASKEIMQSYTAKTVADAKFKPGRKGEASQRNDDIQTSRDAITSPMDRYTG